MVNRQNSKASDESVRCKNGISKATNKRKLGNEKEQIAKKYLESKGYQIIAENFYAKGGEIDLIGREEGYLVFIEVKYRSTSEAGHPLEAVDYQKQNKLRFTAQYYMYKNHISEDTPCRFDVVAILGEEIIVIKDAF